MTDEQLQQLIASCKDAKQFSYSPYSKFKVGAALLCKDGSIVTGCNVENCAYGVGICAEQTAVVKAVSEGKRDFVAIAIISDKEDYISPCGACRQVLAEFHKDLTMYLCKSNGSYQSTVLSELLPSAFLPSSLAKANQ